MSGYIKRVIILRNLARGDDYLLKCEGGASVALTLSPEPSGTLAVFDGERLELFTDSPSSSARLNISKGLTAGIFSSGELTAFGGAGETFSRAEFIKLYKAQTALSSPETAEKLGAALYDDERIADENYYDNRFIAEDLEDEEQSYKYDEAEKRAAAQERAGAGDHKAERHAAAADACAGEDSAQDSGKSGGDFYSTVRIETQKLFSRGTKESGLGEVVPSSKWVRVNYTTDRYYVVGIIEKHDSPEYICYGVPGRYGNPPEKLKSFASFIPSSLFDLHGDGYYVMFQSAKTGEHVVPKIDVFGL